MGCYIIATGIILALVLVSGVAYAAGASTAMDDLQDAAYRIGEDDALGRIVLESERMAQPVESSNSGS